MLEDAIHPKPTAVSANLGKRRERRCGRRDELLTLYNRLIDAYPIVSIEDGFAEDDWDGFRLQTAACGDRVQIVGDDLYVTNPRFIQKGIWSGATNAVLIKLNQIGTVSETIKAVQMCRDADWAYESPFLKHGVGRHGHPTK